MASDSPAATPSAQPRAEPAGATSQVPLFPGAPPVIRWAPIVAGLVAIALGIAVLESYALGLGRLLPFGPFLLSTTPLCGVMFVLTGVSLLALRTALHPLRVVTALGTVLIAALVLTEYAFWVDLGLDTLLFPAAAGRWSRVFPGRPPPVTAGSFFLLSLTLLLRPLPERSAQPRRRTVMLLGALILPLVAIAGHLFGVTELYAVTPRTGTALHAAMALLLLAVGVSVATQPSLVLHLLQAQDPGTVLLRRLLPLAVALPLLFVVGSVWGLRLGLDQVHPGVLLYVTGFIATFVAAAFWAAAMVRRLDEERRSADHAHTELALRERLLAAEMAAGAALRESEHRTRELLAVLTHAPVTARGLDGRIRFWSAGAEQLYGWSATTAVGTRSHELLHTEFPVSQREAEETLLEKGEWHGELTRRGRDGTRVRVASHWILHRGTDNRPEAVIEVDRDVTEQKRAEQALRESEARYRALVAATAQIVWTASPDGGQATDLTQWEAFTGSSAAEVGGRAWLEAIHPDDRADAARVWAEAVRHRQGMITEHRLRRHDGEYRHMEVRVVPVLEPAGAIREWVGAHTDVTDRVRVEQQLRQGQKLQAVGTLAGGVAHEVNNQLMAVLGFGDFVLKALGPDHPQARDVHEMVRAATRAAQIAQQLLTFGRRQPKQTRILDLHAALLALVPVLQRLLGPDKSLILSSTRAHQLVLADPTQIDQILINLTANARDAMGSGGRLSLVTEDVVLDETYARTHGGIELGPGAYVRLTVSDTGSGMDRATLAQIFEPFFTTKPVGQGTGLGLSTVYGIVKQHGGFIWAYSEPGLGTAMKVYLPAAPEGSTAFIPSEYPAGPAHAEERGVVLVVEDEPAIRRLARRSLEGVGFTVLEVEDGRQALEVVATRRELPRLVLTDVIMPGLSGRELGEALAATHPNLPVLFMSGYTGDDVFARGLLPDRAPFIQKPFAGDELVARVREVLAKC